MKDPTQSPELKRFVLPALFVGALFVALVMRRPDISNAERVVTFQGPTMGTTYTVKIVTTGLDNAAKSKLDQDISGARLDQEIIGVLEAVNQAMSTYLRSSELSKFNSHESLEPFPVSEALQSVVNEANRISDLSNGAFDITVAPLVDAWGFGPGNESPPPTPEEVELLRSSVGYTKLLSANNSLTKTDKHLRCDLSAIAKGYGVDKVQETLENLGFKDFMIEVGGEVVTRGRRLDGRLWRIGIERPDPTGLSIHRAIPLNDLALASSGDYRNYREVDGKRISHTIDPRTGNPVTHKLASVTVLHTSCMTADALATTFSVLGAKEGKAMAEKHGFAALFLIRLPNGDYEEQSTAAFEAYLKDPQASP